MHALGLPALRCHNYDVSNARTRTQSRHFYRCDCRAHSISQVMHNRIRRGGIYSCRRCGTAIRPNPHSNNQTVTLENQATDERESFRL